MTIKEVEQQINMKKANIRYYEEEGLISPTRNAHNNYREYTQSDVELLKKIQYLRVLGVPIHEVSALLKGTMDLTAVMERTEQIIKSELKIQQELYTLCEEIRTNEYTIETLKVPSYEARSAFLQMKGEHVMKIDQNKKLKKYEEGFTKLGSVIGYTIIIFGFVAKFLMKERMPYYISIPFIILGVIIVSVRIFLRHKISALRWKKE